VRQLISNALRRRILTMDDSQYLLQLLTDVLQSDYQKNLIFYPLSAGFSFH
jgi:hypothetical protein